MATAIIITSNIIITNAPARNAAMIARIVLVLPVPKTNNSNSKTTTTTTTTHQADPVAEIRNIPR